jgi:hypothetical protein
MILTIWILQATYKGGKAILLTVFIKYKDQLPVIEKGYTVY